MLVLERRRDQCINIGKDIKIKILCTTDSKTKIGIDAPKDVPIWRDDCKKRYSKDSSEDDVYNS